MHDATDPRAATVPQAPERVEAEARAASAHDGAPEVVSPHEAVARIEPALETGPSLFERRMQERRDEMMRCSLISYIEPSDERAFLEYIERERHRIVDGLVQEAMAMWEGEPRRLTASDLRDAR